MRYVHPAVEHGRLAENDILFIETITVLDELDTLEPDKVDKCSTVSKMRHKATGCPFAQLLERAYLTYQLHMLQMTAEFTDLEDTAAVNIFIREIIQQVVQRTYIEFTAKKRCTLFAYTGKKPYASCCDIQHSIMVFATIKSNGVVSLIFSRLPSTETT